MLGLSCAGSSVFWGARLWVCCVPALQKGRNIWRGFAQTSKSPLLGESHRVLQCVSLHLRFALAQANGSRAKKPSWHSEQCCFTRQFRAGRRIFPVLTLHLCSPPQVLRGALPVCGGQYDQQNRGAVPLGPVLHGHRLLRRVPVLRLQRS